MPEKSSSWISFIGSLASILAIAFVPGLWAALYPLPLLVAIGIVCGVLCWLLWRRSSDAPASADQRRLDQLFGTLPRDSIRSLSEEDFGLPWRPEILAPVRQFHRELADVEHELDRKELEELRRPLHEAAGRLLDAEGANGFTMSEGPWRYTGFSPNDLETATPGERHVFNRRRLGIQKARDAFVEAHDALVRRAKRDGFDLRMLSAATPPEPETPYPVRPSPVRAQWPGEASR